VMGLAVLALAIVALPALLKFFTWTVGAIQTHPGGLASLGTTAASGVHAASSLRGVGGSSAAEHARYLAISGPAARGGSGPSGASTFGGTSGVRAAAGGAGPAGGAAAARTAGASATGGAAAPAAGGAGAAAGPAAPVVAGATVAAQAGAQAAKGAASTATGAMEGRS